MSEGYHRAPQTGGKVTVRLAALDEFNPAQDYAFPTTEAAERFADGEQSRGRVATVLTTTSPR